MRLTQSLFPDRRVSLHCFVDDPIASLRGSVIQWRLAVTTMILVWEALGFSLAYRKGQFGPAAVWNGGELAFTSTGVTGQIKQSIIADIVEALLKFRHENVHACKELRSFVGRANHAAGLLVAVRPFLHSLWGALSAQSSSPKNTVWAKQVAHAMSWLRAFFCDNSLSTQRHFSLEEFRAAGPKLEIGTDASPFGLGGWP